jgi:hypothetical protein
MANEYLLRHLEKPLRHAAKIAAVRISCARKKRVSLNEYILQAVTAAVEYDASRDEVVKQAMIPPPGSVTM